MTTKHLSSNEKPSSQQLFIHDDVIQATSDYDHIEELSNPSNILNNPYQCNIDQYLKRINDKSRQSHQQAIFQQNKPNSSLNHQLQSMLCKESSKRQHQKFIIAFNVNAQQAIQNFQQKIHDNSAQQIAAYLVNIDGLNKTVLGEYFAKNRPQILQILRCYCNELNFKDEQFDNSIRRLLGCFRLPGESQQIERIIQIFTESYYNSNSQKYADMDELFPLAYAIIMLSTDAHNPKQQNKMTHQQFLKNTQPVCPSISKEYLSGIYNRITQQKFQTDISCGEIIYAQLMGLTLHVTINDLGRQLNKEYVMLKICRGNSKFVKRNIKLSQDTKRIQWTSGTPNQKPRSINISDIISLSLGCKSEVMIRAKVPKNLDSNCFSIKTHQRTLDLKAKDNQDRSKWVNYIRAILIDRRNQKQKLLQSQVQGIEQLADIWNTEIFPFWDKYWDYKTNKPKNKSYITKGIQAIFCSCCYKNRQYYKINNDLKDLSQYTLLQALWSEGLIHNTRKKLWPLVIGNKLVLNQQLIEDLKHRKTVVMNLRAYQQQFPRNVIELGQLLIVFRLDIAAVRELLLVCSHFLQAMIDSSWLITVITLINFIHLHHLMVFYRGDRSQITLRITFMEYLLVRNIPAVAQHFKLLKLDNKYFLMTWFLSIFSQCFQQSLVLRIWDNYLLHGQIYLFKIGLALIKYYEIQLTTCNFQQALQILRNPPHTSVVLLFNILQQHITVTSQQYDYFINHQHQDLIKIQVQSIPLKQ